MRLELDTLIINILQVSLSTKVEGATSIKSKA